MENDEKRKFFDEIYFLGEQKEFAKGSIGGFVKKTVSAINPFSLSGKDAFAKRRKAYNFAFVRCCENYGIEGDIYPKLDAIWAELGDLGYELRMISKLELTEAPQTANVWSKFANGIDEARKLGGVLKYMPQMMFRQLPPVKAMETIHVWTKYIDKTRKLAEELVN